VRYIEENTKGGAHGLGHGHHHSHKRQNKLKDDDESNDVPNLVDSKSKGTKDMATDYLCPDDGNEHETILRKVN